MTHHRLLIAKDWIVDCVTWFRLFSIPFFLSMFLLVWCSTTLTPRISRASLPARAQGIMGQYIYSVQNIARINQLKGYWVNIFNTAIQTVREHGPRQGVSHWPERTSPPHTKHARNTSSRYLKPCKPYGGAWCKSRCESLAKVAFHHLDFLDQAVIPFFVLRRRGAPVSTHHPVSFSNISIILPYVYEKPLYNNRKCGSGRHSLLRPSSQRCPRQYTPSRQFQQHFHYCTLCLWEATM